MSGARLTRRALLRGELFAGVSRADAERPRAPWEPRRRAALAMAIVEREARTLPFECIGPSSFCTTCAERCPVPGALVMESGRPRIDAARCDGCGACEDACPAPRKAIVVVPRMGGSR